MSNLLISLYIYDFKEIAAGGKGQKWGKANVTQKVFYLDKV